MKPTEVNGKPNKTQCSDFSQTLLSCPLTLAAEESESSALLQLEFIHSGAPQLCPCYLP